MKRRSFFSTVVAVISSVAWRKKRVSDCEYVTAPHASELAAGSRDFTGEVWLLRRLLTPEEINAMNTAATKLKFPFTKELAGN